MSRPHPGFPRDMSSPERPLLSEMSSHPMADSQELHCKLILSNSLAGSLIGKNGSTISAIRNKSGATIRISNVINLYSPERLALLGGVKEALQDALDQVVELGAQPYGADSTTMSGGSLDNGIMMKVLIPKSSVSILIGKGGQRINEMRQMTGAKIHVSTKEESPVPAMERIVKIIGNSVPSVSQALLLVVKAIQVDPRVKELHNFGPEPNHNSPIGHPYSPTMHQMSPYNNGQQILSSYPMNTIPVEYYRHNGLEPWMAQGRTCEIFMQVPDAYVGMLVGKSGQHLSEIKQLTNAKIEITKKGHFVEGTSDRLVTISGNIMNIHAAHARLMRRVIELEEQENRSAKPKWG